MARGFTLIETLLVIGIMMLLATIGYLTSFTYLRSQELSVAAETVASELARAQSEAYVQTNESAHGVAVFTDRVVRFQGDSYVSRTLSADLVTEFPTPVLVSGLNEVIFFPGTVEPVAAGIITLSGDNQAFDISISTYGVVEVTRRTIQP